MARKLHRDGRDGPSGQPITIGAWLDSDDGTIHVALPRINIAAGANSGSVTEFPGVPRIPAGSSIRFEVLQVGTDVTGADLTITTTTSPF
jgi:hypothetical protein